MKKGFRRDGRTSLLPWKCSDNHIRYDVDNHIALKKDADVSRPFQMMGTRNSGLSSSQVLALPEKEACGYLKVNILEARQVLQFRNIASGLST